MKTAEKKSLSELVDVVCAHGINVVFDVGDNDNWIDTLRHEALGANVVILIITRSGCGQSGKGRCLASFRGSVH